jgi:hypothetical protein
MQKWLCLLLILFSFSCKQKTTQQEQLTYERIEYICFLKDIVNEKIWGSVTDKKYDLPLLYYTDTSSFVVNPTDKFLATFKPNLVYQSRNVKIYKTLQRMDSIPFHMATGIEVDDTASYMYQSPFMKCSSLALTRQYIPDVLSTEQWATMILHEYFHGFQFKHEAFLNQTNQVNISGDSLQRIYLHNLWYNDKIETENGLLLKALASKNDAETIAFVDTFFKIRNERRVAARASLKIDVKPYELVYEEMEGTARYIEYGLYHYFTMARPYYPLSKTDTAYHSYNYYKDNYSLETKDAWMYQSNQTSYFYATGFNMARLLDKLKIPFKSRLFRETNISLESILATATDKNTVSVH